MRWLWGQGKMLYPGPGGQDPTPCCHLSPLCQDSLASSLKVRPCALACCRRLCSASPGPPHHRGSLLLASSSGSPEHFDLGWSADVLHELRYLFFLSVLLRVSWWEGSGGWGRKLCGAPEEVVWGLLLEEHTSVWPGPLEKVRLCPLYSFELANILGFGHWDIIKLVLWKCPLCMTPLLCAVVLISSVLSVGASLLSEVSELSPVASPRTCGACPPSRCLMILILIPRLINDLNTSIRDRQAGHFFVFWFLVFFRWRKGLLPGKGRSNQLTG